YAVLDALRAVSLARPAPVVSGRGGVAESTTSVNLLRSRRDRAARPPVVLAGGAPSFGRPEPRRSSAGTGHHHGPSAVERALAATGDGAERAGRGLATESVSCSPLSRASAGSCTSTRVRLRVRRRRRAGLLRPGRQTVAARPRAHRVLSTPR